MDQRLNNKWYDFFRKNTAGFFFLLLFLFSVPLFSAPMPAQNKTKYIPPKKEKILARLAQCRNWTEKYPGKNHFCVRQEYNIEVYVDFSCRKAWTKELFFPSGAKDCSLPEMKGAFVEVFYPEGTYKAFHSPQKLSLPANSLLILKSSRFTPPVPGKDFFLECILDNAYPTAETIIEIAYTRNQKVYHAVTPPYMGRLPLIKRFRKNSYLISSLPENHSRRQDERTCLHVSGVPSWQVLARDLLQEKKKNTPFLPPLPAVTEKMALKEKILFLYEKAKTLPYKEKEYILSRWLTLAGIKAYVSKGKKGRNINMNLAGNVFSFDLVCIPEQKGFRSRLWLDLAAEKAGALHIRESRIAVLLLIPGRGEITFIREEEWKRGNFKSHQKSEKL